MQTQTVSNNYCQHFLNFKSAKKLVIQSQAFCKFCLQTKNHLWMCLHKNCGAVICGKNHFLHLKSHLQGKQQQLSVFLESKKNKSFHSIYININTAQIRCQCCKIQILDLEQLSEKQIKMVSMNGQPQNPIKFRSALYPFLLQLGQSKIIGQLQFPEGHRKINRGLVGVFATRYNYDLLASVLFLFHIDFFKEILFDMKDCSDYKQKEIIGALKANFKQIQEAKYRAIRIDKLYQELCKKNIDLKQYCRKNPFQHILYSLGIVHENIKFYRLKNQLENLGKDEWDLFYAPNKTECHCPIYDSLTSVLKLVYRCPKCQFMEERQHSLNYLKLELPKKKRKNKVVENQLNQKGYQSPRKRGKSLISLFMPEEQLPITVPQLLIDFMKSPFHDEIFCQKCQSDQVLMKPVKMFFEKIADILILQINRMPKHTDQTIKTEVLMSYEDINLGSFTAPQKSPTNDEVKAPKNQQEQKQNLQPKSLYQFCTMVGIQNGCFPVVTRSKYNNQLYLIRNEIVQMMPNNSRSKSFPKINPYIVCLKKKNSIRSQQFFEQIMNQNQILNGLRKCEGIKQQQKRISSVGRNQMYTLPDFYHLQLKHGIQLPLYQPLVCKHNKLKPNLEKKALTQIKVTEKLYQRLASTYRGTLFINSTCDQCLIDLQSLQQRKEKEKQLIRIYDKYKVNASVMISVVWLKKWSKFLYSNEKPAFFHKGYPLPPPINNNFLLHKNMIRDNLVKNKDFKVVNIFIFKLLKQLYGGGPEIRYKWKNSELSSVDESKVRQIKLQAQQLKLIYDQMEDLASSKKTIVIQKSSSFMETVNQQEEIGEQQSP